MKYTNAMDFLKEYGTLQRSCQIIDEQMFEIASLLREIKRDENGNEPENVTGRINKYVAKLTDDYKHLSLRKRLLTYRINLIESVVESLPKNERTVIDRFFLSPDKHYAADDLMEELEFEKTHIYRLRTRALEMIEEIIENIPLCEEAHEDT
jgi:hypothetical protein